MTGWHDADSARPYWNPPIEDEQYDVFLDIARDVCEGYAPELPTADVPERYRLAQVLYARDTFNSAKAAPSGGYDGDSFAITPFPLSWKVKGLLRPQRRVPAVG